MDSNNGTAQSISPRSNKVNMKAIHNRSGEVSLNSPRNGISNSISYLDVLSGDDLFLHSQSFTRSPNRTAQGESNLGNDEDESFLPPNRSSNVLHRQRFAEWLEWESMVDVEKLKAAAFYGVPHDIRAEVWRFLLGMSKPERSDELSENKKRALQYSERLKGVDEAGEVSRRARAEAKRRLQRLSLQKANEVRIRDRMKSNAAINAQSSSGANIAAHSDSSVVSPISNQKNGTVSFSVTSSGEVESSRDAPEERLSDRGSGGRIGKNLGDSSSESSAASSVNEVVRIYGRVVATALNGLGSEYEYGSELVSLLTPFVDIMDEEHDVFHCYYSLLQRHEALLRTDGSVLKRSVASFLTMFRNLQSELWDHFESEEVNAAQWVPSWLQSLLSKQLPLPQVLRLWDTYFSCNEGLELHAFVCLAIVDLNQEELLELDGAEVLSFLHTLPQMDMDRVIAHAYNTREDVIGRGIL